MTAYGTIEKAVEAIKKGAYDLIRKPLNEERLFHLLRKGLELNRLVRENAHLTEKMPRKETVGSMVGQSRTMPPLDQIREDIPLLVDHFLDRVAFEQDMAVHPKGTIGTIKGELAPQITEKTKSKVFVSVLSVCSVVKNNWFLRSPRYRIASP